MQAGKKSTLTLKGLLLKLHALQGEGGDFLQFCKPQSSSSSVVFELDCCGGIRGSLDADDKSVAKPLVLHGIAFRVVI
jgi:hypothetical protein